MDAKRVVWENGKLLDDCRGGDGEEDAVGDAVANLTEYEDNVCDVQAQGTPEDQGHAWHRVDDLPARRLLQFALDCDQQLRGKGRDDGVEYEEESACDDARLAESKRHPENGDADAALEED